MADKETKLDHADAAFDLGWDGALDAFEKQWKSKPKTITCEELIHCTNRLLRLLRER